jgi:hypothetical protein
VSFPSSASEATRCSKTSHFTKTHQALDAGITKSASSTAPHFRSRIHRLIVRHVGIIAGRPRGEPITVQDLKLVEVAMGEYCDDRVIFGAGGFSVRGLDDGMFCECFLESEGWDGDGRADRIGDLRR